MDRFGEGGIGWGHLRKEVEGLGSVVKLVKIGLGIGEAEKVIGVPVFGELTET